MAQKVFLNVPREGRTKENVQLTFDKMEKVSKCLFGDDIEVFTDEEVIVPENVKNEKMYRAGARLMRMAEADTIVGIRYPYAYAGDELANDSIEMARTFNRDGVVFWESKAFGPDLEEIGKAAYEKKYGNPAPKSYDPF